MRRGWLLALLCVAGGAGAWERQVLDLSGAWEMARCKSRDDPLPAAGWQGVTVPGVVPGYRYERAWFRRSLDVHAAWQGRRIVLCFNGARWNSRVLVNGQPVGGHFGGFDRFDLDVSAAVRPGAANTILVGLHDWTGVFDPQAAPVEWSDKSDIREQPVNRVLAPIGGVMTNFGIWDKCWLIATPAVRADEVFVVPSVRRHRLEVRVKLGNAGAAASARVTAEVRELEGETPVLSLPAATADVPAAGSADVTLAADWAAPHLWSHEDPHLYNLRVSVTSGAESEEQTVRFGFREFWCQGPDFYLNGRHIHLLSSSWWPPSPNYTDDQVREVYAALKAANTSGFRTHTQPWPENWYSVADEMGMLMIPEGAVWNDDGVYKLDDQRFWDNYRTMLLAMTGCLRNHPSIVMWSLENEFYGGRINDKSAEWERKLADLSDAVRTADPTRPAFYESDLDPGGKADVIGIHYPNEWPEEYQWPNCADWLDDGQPRRLYGFWDDQLFAWNRKKPVYIGEYLWIPSSNPDWSTIFLGDEAYRDYHWARDNAKAISWEMQIKGYRRAGVSGQSPWTMIEGGALTDRNPLWRAHLDAYRPRAAFAREYDRRFYAGDPVVRTFDIYNDTLTPAAMTLRVGFQDAAGKPAGKTEAVRLPAMQPGDHRVEKVTLAAPPAGELQLRAALEEGGRSVFEDLKPAVSHARQPLPAVAAGLFDPRGTAGALAKAGLKLTTVKSLQGELPPLLIIAPDALGTLQPGTEGVPVVGGPGGPAQRLMRHVAAGGKLLVFRQNVMPSALFGLQTTARASTMAFPAATAHPVLTGLGADDFKFWRGDHLVSRSELVRPTTGGCVALVVAGSGGGLTGAPLLEVRRGSGTALFCSLQVTDKLAAEPAAARLLANMLSYLDGYQGAELPTSVWCRDAAARAVLDAAGLEATVLDGEAPLAEGARVAVIHDPPALAPWLPQLRSFVDGGGRLVLSDLRPEAAGDLTALGVGKLNLSAAAGPVVKLEGATGPLAEALLREDIYWLGKSDSVIGWSDRPRLPNQCVAAVVPQVPAAGGTTYECEAMAVEGAYARADGDHVILASTGTVTGPIDVPAAGSYVIAVTGWGSPCNQVFPVVAVSVDGAALGEVYLGSRAPADYGVAARLTAGRHTLLLRFTNDANSPTEDRNAFLDRIRVVASDEPLGMTPLTSPAAILEKQVGRGLVVVDELRWPAAEGNEQKAQRHIAALLTALGATFRSTEGTLIEGESMRIQPGLAYGGPAGDHMAMVQACWAETGLDVQQPGRYRLLVVARGVPAKDVWPHFKVTLDGTVVGDLVIDSSGWRPYKLSLDLAAGKHVLRLTYDNDQWSPPEDRNVFLDKLILDPLP
ncbi:MAG: hypothetical protein HYU66_05285 [Armatimonadetes bacterium]|nr:hypothetical protein [Armatimonadota bacterium]